VVGEISYYGHRENDLVRLPDPTNVLKYPHIVMTGPAQRGYVVSASSMFDPENYPFWKVFDNDTTTNGNQWISYNGSYNADGTYAGSTSNVTQESSNSWVGEWLQIELPHRIQITDVQVLRENNDTYGTSRSPNSGAVLGSNNGSSWVYIHDFSNKPHTDYTSASFTSLGDIITGGYYKYLRLVVTKVQNQTTTGNTNGRLVSICELQLYGTEEATPVPIQIGGGNIDRVANFRVYDKFVGEDQALEIWDAQKDEFRGVKNSMTLHKGRLGIGTTEPEGRLAVLDEPHNLEEFPPGAMTDYKTYFEGHGEFCVSASDEYTATPRLTWKAFNKSSENIDDGWMHSGAGYTGASSGTAAGTTPTYNGTQSLGGIGGDWISLEFPYKVKLNGFKITSYHVGSSFRGLNDGFLLGRNDKNSEWTRVQEITNLYAVYGVRDAPQLSAEISFTNDDYYNEYALIATSTTGETLWTAMELKYFGTREQRQSVLHDGQLTLTKNLDVPRIGPPLDADDTPSRDRLVVEYNTSSNPTFEGAVRDTSGRGNDIVMHGNAEYDASEKAFRLDGTSGTYMSGTQNLGTGTPAHTITGWFKQVVSLNNWTYVMFIGTSANGQQSGMLVSNTGQIVFDIFNTRIDTTVDVVDGRWYHFAGVFKGGTSTWDNASTDLYINGQLEGSAAPDSGTQYSFNLTGNGIQFGSSTNFNRYFNGSISNFKLYDTALTASEVKTLYDMGRTGRVVPKTLQIDTPVQINAPLYAPGTIVNVSQFVDTDDYSQASDNTNFTTTLTTPEISMKAGSKVHLHVCIPWRHDYEAGWSGGYHLIYFRLNKTVSGVAASTWVMLSNSGYHMDYGSSVIGEYTNSYYLPLSVNEDFTIQFEHRYRPYTEVANAFRINQSHHLDNYVDANLLKLGFQANNMGYLKFIVTEISK
jgi:hypothetical protein